MANEDIFKYAPVSEWNGMIVDFDMPSSDGNTRLTEICRAADACLEASNKATLLSFTDSTFAKAREPSVQKIIRTLFGEKPGVTIKTYAAVGEDGTIYFISPMVIADMQIESKNWAVEIINNYIDLSLHLTYIVTYPDPYGENGEKVVINSARHQRNVLNPLAVGLIITGNRPIAGNWNTDGEPYVEINWESISTGRCTDNVTTNQTACEQVVLGGVCREQQPGRGYCSDSAYRNNESGCLNANETWSSSVGTPPLAMKIDSGFCSDSNYDGQYLNCINQNNVWTEEGWVEANIDYAGDYYCTYASTSGYTNGRCFYQTTNTNTQGWNAWGGTGTTESTCKDYATNQYKWAYWMWIPPGNVYTNQYAVWRPSYDGSHTDVHGNSNFIQGTVNSWKHFNIKTANNHRKYPINHVPSQIGTNLRIYHSDSNSSWGNGIEVGRSTIPLWITNSFDWADNDNTYDYCHDPGGNHLTEWSSPSGYYDHGVACLAAGTCTGDRSPGNYHNNQVDCETAEGNNGYICSGGGHTSQSACVNSGYTWYDCSAGGWTNSTACTNAGECFSHSILPGGGFQEIPWSQFNNNPQACLDIVSSAHYHYYGYTWDSHWTNHGYQWYQANNFTSDNNTWDSIIPDIEIEIPIAADYLWKPMFPPHSFVDSTDSRPLYEQGYTTSYTITALHAIQSQIRWKPPQTDQADYLRTYPRPSKFRIYRAPAWYQDLTAFTDFTEEIWKLAGEVITKNDSGYHYFYDTREDMINEGLGEFQHAYYGITAVWEDWNYKRGFTLKQYPIGCFDWDIAHPNTNADLDNVENATLAAGYPQLVNSVRIGSAPNYTTYRASGYFKAPVTGVYTFQVTGDDAIYLWLGANGESIPTLVNYRSWYNYVAAVPGLHPAQIDNGTINLTEGEIYPLLSYCGNHEGNYAFYIRIHYPDGDWNNGGDGNGEWKYVPIDMMPEEMTPGTDGEGQTVEGNLAATEVPAWYTNFP